MRFNRRPFVVEAVQWFPDPARGNFDGGDYYCKSIGYDQHGIGYTACDVGLQTPAGFMKIMPGDWIVSAGGKKWIVEQDVFGSLYWPLDQSSRSSQ